MLSSKQRLLAILFATVTFIVPALMNQIAILLNLGANPTDIALFQNTTTIVYEYDTGVYGDQDSTLTLVLDASDLITTKVTSTYGGDVENWDIDYSTGKIKGTETYTMFWIPIKNPMLNLAQFAIATEFSVKDVIGILGTKGLDYTLRIGEKKVYWDVNPELAGAQFSFVIRLYKSDETLMAEGLMDSTAGFLETFLGGPDNNRLTILSPGNYQISRNRYNMFLWGIVFGIALPTGIFLYMRKKKYDEELTKEFTLVVLVGIIATLVDIDMDVWFYAWFGMAIMLYIHIACALVIGLICWRLGYGGKWAFPALIEVAFVWVMNRFVGDPYVPHLTAFMGIFLAFFGILYRSGIEKRGSDDKLGFLI